jgi:aminopeptidase
MKDPRTIRLAETLVNYCVEVQPGDKVFLRGSLASRPLVREIYRQIICAGGHPLVQYDDEALDEIFFKKATDDQLQYIAEPSKLIVETYDCIINARGAFNTRALSGVNPSKQSLARKAGSELGARIMQRAAEGSLRWVTTMYPTAAFAQEADMSLPDFEDFVYGACHVDKADPIAQWRAVSARQQVLVDWLAGKKDVVVRGPNVDLRLSIEGRSFVNSDGHKNMPSGEIYTGPVEDSVNGHVRFSYPAIVNGREVSGIELVFEDGKVIQASAEKNEPYLLQMLDSDPGARYVGEFAIGTNEGIQHFTKSILYDEKIAGTMHMALGRGYPETGSKNESAIHWDMICDMRDGGEILVDGVLFYDSGEFKI